MNLTELREQAALSIPELARKAEVDAQTIRNAEEGKRISARVARQIAGALTKALDNRSIKVRDIDGLNVRL